MARQRPYDLFELRIGQLTLILEVVTKKRIGQCLRLVAASMLEEIRRLWIARGGSLAMDARRPGFYSLKEQLPVTALNYPFTDD